jgi:hypothetical protein
MKQHAPLAAWALCCGLAALPAQAELALRLGAPDVLNHFPSFITDAQNQAVQLCLDGDGISGPCLFDPAANAPTSAWAQLVGFGGEASYSVARSTLLMPNGRRAELSVGLHATYGSGQPFDGAQQIVSRVRYRIQVPGPGLYQVYHPYMAYPACQPEAHSVPVGAPNVIDHASERGAAAPFRTLLGGDVGAILRWDPAVAPAAPAGYLGDPRVAHPLVGSPCGVNSFRIVGPNIGGAGVGNAQTTAFRVAGKAFTAGPTAAPLTVDRATYTRNAQGTRLSIYGRADPNATVTLSPVVAISPGTSVRPDADGNFFIQAVSSVPSIPGSVALTTNPADPAARVLVLVQERLDITSAVYSPTTRTLVVRALSGDIAPLAPLVATAGDAGSLAMTRVGTTNEHVATFTNMAVPPPAVSVMSSRGGRDTALVQD